MSGEPGRKSLRRKILADFNPDAPSFGFTISRTSTTSTALAEPTGDTLTTILAG